MIRLGICDDEQVFGEHTKHLCEEYFEEKNDKVEIITFTSGTQVLEYKKYLDILLLDIEMEDISGIEVKDSLEKRGRNTKIVFITNYEQYAITGYGMYVCGYLKKPLGKMELICILDKLCAQLGEGAYYYVDTRQGKFPVLMDAILYIESNDHSCTVMTEQEKYDHRKPISAIERELTEYHFFRCHKSYIVNLNYIDRVEKDILMKNGDVVQVSRRKESELRERYIKIVQEKIDNNRIQSKKVKGKK